MLIGIDASRAFSGFVGGPENYSYYLIRALLTAGSSHKFRLYLRSDSAKSPRYQKFFEDLSIANYQLSIIKWPFLWTQGGLALECLLNPPDVLFVPAHTIPLIRLPGLKTVVTIHDLGAQFLPNYHKFPQKYYLNFATEFAIKNATKVVAVSKYTRDDIIRRFKDSSGRTPQNDSIIFRHSERSEESFKIKDKISVVYEGYDRSLFYPQSREEIDRVKSKYGIDGDYFLFVGTIQPRKNLVRLIEAFSRVSGGLQLRPQFLQGEALQKLTLIIAGSPGWFYDEIYKAPEKFGVVDRVEFPGKVPDEDLPALMSGCKAFVFPSLYEGFGLSLLEAMACGVITVTSNVTSLPEVGEEAPFYINPENIGEITKALEKVQKLTSQEREKIGNKSLDQAKKFSWQESAKQVLSLLDSM